MEHLARFQTFLVSRLNPRLLSVLVFVDGTRNQQCIRRSADYITAQEQRITNIHLQDLGYAVAQIAYLH